jgi:GTP pyrophosphokinase
MMQKGKTLDQIYDLFAVRVVVNTVNDCYHVLGALHEMYKPVPGRFKDYIAMPKPNLYQSLHTTIHAGDGNIYEVQIRTHKMDEIAEEGIAAHWRYKEDSDYNPKKEQKEIEAKLHWFRDFVAMSRTSGTNAKEYMESINRDIFEANVYVFTPKGKVIDLPSGATPLDFAYRIHTKIGDATTGALVNGALVPLSTALKTGDVVEIRTSKNPAGPNEGWLKLVKTNLAKTHIKKTLQKRMDLLLKEERILKGKTSMQEAMREFNLNDDKMKELLSRNDLLSHFGVSEISELYLLVFNRVVVPTTIMEFLGYKKEFDATNIRDKHIENVKKLSSQFPIYVKGVAELAITLAKCCTPIPGDKITGYISRGKGIVVHRVTCPNIQNSSKRMIEVFWRDDLAAFSYPVDIKIIASDRNNLLNDVMGTLAQHKINITKIAASLAAHNKTALIDATIYVADAKKLNDVLGILKNIGDVLTVERVIH